MITISNSTFDTQGSSIKDQVFGITLSGNEDILIKDCVFSNKGYSSILNNSTAKVEIEDCEFNCGNVYNPIEGSQTYKNSDVTVKNCSFNGVPGNNYVNFYKVADNSKHVIEKCTFQPSVNNNVLRLSNLNNAKANFEVKDCEYTFADGDATKYTAFLLCQDYTNKEGSKQEFANYSVDFEGLICNGSAVNADTAPAKGIVYYVYEDGQGIITGQNDPVINFK